MGDVVDLNWVDPRIIAERARAVRALHELAERLDAAPIERLAYALPVVASGVEDLSRRLSVCLR